MKERISVIMAFYNCEATLAEAIDSLYKQSCQCFKLILCDDASTDDGYEIAKCYAEKHNNIILLKNEKNLKLAASLNRCLEYADTEYTARMDADDLSLPERFEKQVEFLDNHPEFAIVSSPMIYFDKNGDWGTGSCKAEPDKNSFRFGVPHPHAPSMFRTSIIKEVGGYEVSNKTIRVEDYYLWYRIYDAGYKGYNLSEPLYKMRDNEVAVRRRNFKTRLNGFRARRDVLSKFGICCPLLFAMPSLLKAFVPPAMMIQLRKLISKK